MRVVSPELSLRETVACRAKSQEVGESVGFEVGIEQNERPDMVRAETVRRFAVTALIVVAFHGCIAGPLPVRASIVFVSAAPRRVVFAGHVGSHELAAACVAAKVSSLNSTRVSLDHPPALTAILVDDSAGAILWTRSLPETVTNLAAEVTTGPLGEIGLDEVIGAAVLAG